MRWTLLALLCACGMDVAAVDQPIACERGGALVWAEELGGTCGSAVDVIHRQMAAKCSANLSSACADGLANALLCPDGSEWTWHFETLESGERRATLVGPSDTAESCESAYKLTDKRD